MDYKETSTLCRLCYQNANSTLELLTDIKKETLKCIIPEMDLNSTCDPKICKCCSEMLETCQKFKTRCLIKKEPEDIKMKHDLMNKDSRLEEILPLKQELIHTECSFCHSEKDDLVELGTRESDFLKTIFHHIPELVIASLTTSCRGCLSTMESMSTFIVTCLNTDKLIGQSRKANKLNSSSKDENHEEKMACGIIVNKLELKREITDPEETASDGDNRPPSTRVKMEPEIDNQEAIFEVDDIKMEEPEFVDKHELVSELLGKTHAGQATKIPEEKQDPLYVKDGTAYRCSVCPFRSNLLGILKHEVVHKKPKEETQQEEDTEEEDEPAYVKEGKEYKCLKCSFTSDFLCITKHVTVHKDTKVKWFRCKICPFQSKHRRSLRRHTFNHEKASGIKTYNCETCSFQTKYENVLAKHLIRHKENGCVQIYKCEKCTYESKNKYHYAFHQLVHKDPSEVTMFKCEFCPFQTKRLKTIKCHVSRHKDPEILKCPDCIFKTHQKILFSNHLLLHKSAGNVQVFSCDVCGYLATKRYYVDRHMVIHKESSQIPRFECEICHKLIKQKKNFNEHMLKHRDPAEIIVYKCEKCPFKSKIKLNFDNHVARHKKVQEFTCDECDYKTTVRSRLARHEVVHKDRTEVKLFECDECSFQSKHSGSLRCHRLTHRKDVAKDEPKDA